MAVAALLGGSSSKCFEAVTEVSTLLACEALRNSPDHSPLIKSFSVANRRGQLSRWGHISYAKEGTRLLGPGCKVVFHTCSHPPRCDLSDKASVTTFIASTNRSIHRSMHVLSLLDKAVDGLGTHVLKHLSVTCRAPIEGEGILKNHGTA